jgi:hypothetical protein
MAWELGQLADAIDRLRRLNADLRRTSDREEKRMLSEQQRASRLEVIAALDSVRVAAQAGDGDAKEFLTELESPPT